MSRQLLFMFLGLVAGTALALLLGAKNFGTALVIGQLSFAASLVYVLMRD